MRKTVYVASKLGKAPRMLTFKIWLEESSHALHNIMQYKTVRYANIALQLASMGWLIEGKVPATRRRSLRWSGLSCSARRTRTGSSFIGSKWVSVLI